jgi:hypothetical protein
MIETSVLGIDHHDGLDLAETFLAIRRIHPSHDQAKG